MLCKLLLK